MNLAALWRLPVLFLCENNLYAMGTAIERHQAQPEVALKAPGYAMRAESVDGMDVEAVEDAARRAVLSIRAGDGPCFLEARTYRFRAHSMYDPELYRDKVEVEHWKERDPITLLEGRMRARGLLDDEAVAALEVSVAADINDAVARAESGTLEPVADLLRHVYAEATA